MVISKAHALESSIIKGQRYYGTIIKSGHQARSIVLGNLTHGDYLHINLYLLKFAILKTILVDEKFTKCGGKYYDYMLRVEILTHLISILRL